MAIRGQQDTEPIDAQMQESYRQIESGIFRIHNEWNARRGGHFSVKQYTRPESLEAWAQGPVRHLTDVSYDGGEQGFVYAVTSRAHTDLHGRKNILGDDYTAHGHPGSPHFYDMLFLPIPSKALARKTADLWSKLQAQRFANALDEPFLGTVRTRRYY